jgi:Fur family ferric uptake transcriptional regulator
MGSQEQVIFRQYIADQGLKSTPQREIILDEFLRLEHPSTEDLYQSLRRKHPNIGYATVHRALKLFAECGIATVRNFGDGAQRFESCPQGEHHDHLVCTECGLIIEFENSQIEKLQQQVAQSHSFSVIDHRLELYGRCEKCQ